MRSWVNGLDEHGLQEVKKLCRLPFIHHHLALMPDAHGGKGMPIGGVLATKGVVVPNAVGVDIGCGMAAQSDLVRIKTRLSPVAVIKG